MQCPVSQLLKSDRTCCDFSLLLQAAVYGMAQTLPDRSLVKEMANQFIDALYTTND